MNNIYSIYRLDSGLFTGDTISCDSLQLVRNVPDDCGCLLGEYNPCSQKVDLDTGLVVAYEMPAVDIVTIKRKKLAAINVRCESDLAMVKASYPEGEVQSWAKQEAEARAFVADSSAPIPLIEALAEARGIPVPELASRIIAKADAFAVVSGRIIGNRQRCEDEIQAATTIEQVEAVTWDV